MGFFLSLISVCFFTYLGVWFGIKSYVHFHQKFFLNHKEFTEGTALYLALLFGMGLFSFMSFIPFTIVALWGFAGAGILSFSQIQISMKKHLFFQGLLCLASVLALYPFSENSLTSLSLAFLWWFIWRVMVWFDRFPLTSLLVSLGWTMAILTTGLLLRTIPNTIVAITSLLGAMTFLFSSFKVSQKQPVLGQLISSLLGFVWAGVWIYFLKLGAVFQTLTAFGYYLFEVGFLIVALICHKPFQTLLAGSLTDPQLAPKAVKSVFSHILLLSLCATVMMRIPSASLFLLFALAVLLLDLYLRLNNLKNPLPTWRELFKNAHQGMTDLVEQVKQTAFSPKRKTVSSKKVQKTPIKKKAIKKRKTKK